MANIYDAFDYMNDNEYEKNLRNESNKFVPLGSKKNKAKVVRFSPITFKPQQSQSRKTNVSPSTTTAMYGIRGTMPIITYDRDLGRPFSPIEINTKLDLGRASDNMFKPIEQKSVALEPSSPLNRGSPTTYIDYKRSLATDANDDDWGFHDKRFRGGKKRTRKAHSRSARKKRTKKSYSRRYRGRKSRR